MRRSSGRPQFRQPRLEPKTFVAQRDLPLESEFAQGSLRHRLPMYQAGPSPPGLGPSNQNRPRLPLQAEETLNSHWTRLQFIGAHLVKASGMSNRLLRRPRSFGAYFTSTSIRVWRDCAGPVRARPNLSAEVGLCECDEARSASGEQSSRSSPGVAVPSLQLESLDWPTLDFVGWLGWLVLRHDSCPAQRVVPVRRDPDRAGDLRLRLRRLALLPTQVCGTLSHCRLSQPMSRRRSCGGVTF